MKADPPAVDWWAVWHRVADGCPLKFKAVGALTLRQLECLASERPPSSGPSLDTPEAVEAYRARRRREDEDWG